jgi:hypothetical protein
MPRRPLHWNRCVIAQNRGRLKGGGALGLKNVEIKQLDILDIDDSLGQFDYIISHGVYSRVPPAVQNKILDLCKRHLAANSVAYISYNIIPDGMYAASCAT